MESKVARFERLIIALEQLSSTASLQAEHGDAVVATDCLARSDAIVADLSPLAAELRRENLLPPALLLRARALMETHEHIRDLINARLAIIRTQLLESNAATSRIRKISPVYGAYKPANHAGKANHLQSAG